MKFFALQWWHPEEGKYKQEYFLTIEAMMARYKHLDNDVPEADPTIETLHFED